MRYWSSLKSTALAGCRAIRTILKLGQYHQ